jgi:hypothetical protein
MTPYILTKRITQAISFLALGLMISIMTAPARADEPVDAPRQAAMQWLALIDGGRYQESWAAASKDFQARVSEDTWSAALTKATANFGKLKTRQYSDTKSAPDSTPTQDVKIVLFHSDFSNRSGLTELVTVRNEAGRWKVAGYFIR